MNTSNRLLTQTENEEISVIAESTNKRYNLRPRPKNRLQFAMAQNDEQSIILPKTPAHIMLTQLKIKDGLMAYDNKGDEAILKELKQLHT